MARGMADPAEDRRAAEKYDDREDGNGPAELFKQEKINPASGRLPILIQLPIFRVARLHHDRDAAAAPFYGCIHDLSAPDLTTIFNLFDATPLEFLMLGVWPLIYGAGRCICAVQKMTPMATTDPAQARSAAMPDATIPAFFFARFPAGSTIYCS